MSLTVKSEQHGHSSVRLQGMRRAIANQMAKSHAEIPGVHIIDEVDVSGLPLSRLLPVIVTATSCIIRKYSHLNAHFDGEELTTFDYCNVGIAVDTDDGLVVPVIRSANEKSVVEIAQDIDDLALRAREKALTPTDMKNATITVTSPGKRGGIIATPLINPPQTAIIGVHRAFERPTVHEGSIQVRKIANVTTTFDHRVIDGAEAGDFTIELVHQIEATVRHLANR
nr:2-oxo acid dehydrogenase subunit E2 [Brevibacterium siliguriense]